MSNLLWRAFSFPRWSKQKRIFLQLVLISISLLNSWLLYQQKSTTREEFSGQFNQGIDAMIFINFIFACGILIDMSCTKNSSALTILFGYIWIFSYTIVLFSTFYSMFNGLSPCRVPGVANMSASIIDKYIIKLSSSWHCVVASMITILEYFFVIFVTMFLCLEKTPARNTTGRLRLILPMTIHEANEDPNDQPRVRIQGCNNSSRARRYYPAYSASPRRPTGEMPAVEDDNTNTEGNHVALSGTTNNNLHSEGTIPSYEHLEASHQFSNPPKYDQLSESRA